MALFDALIKPALDSVTTLISQFHLSPEDQLKAQQAVAAAAQQAQLAAMDYDVKLNDIAGQNIRAETQSQDRFTARSRATFIYVIVAVFAFNYILIPFAQIFGSHVAPIILPEGVLYLFGVVLTGYGTMHSIESIAKLPGDSQMNILGLKVGNKS